VVLRRKISWTDGVKKLGSITQSQGGKEYSSCSKLMERKRDWSYFA